MDFRQLLRAQIAGKALPYRAEWADRYTPTSIYAPGATNTRQGATITQAEAKTHSDALGGQQAMDWVHDAISEYTNSATAADWYFEKDGKRLFNHKREDVPGEQPLADRMLVELFEKPNPFMDFAELLELLIDDLLLVGNGYWYKWRAGDDGKPLGLFRLAPGYVTIEQGDLGPQKYIYQPPGVRDPLELQPQDVAHFKLPNPHSQYYGLGIIKRGGRPLDLELALVETQASYYENKADPSLIVESERRVPRDVFRSLRAQLRQRTAGPNRAGELLVLQAGLKAKTLTPTAAEAAFVELGRMSRDRVLAMFKVSPMLLGIIDEATGGIKPQDVRREFDNHVMRPFLKKLARKISTAVCEPWGVDFLIDHKYMLAEEDLVKVGGDFAALPGVRVKDIRKFVLVPLGMSESTGDKDIDDMVLNLPGDQGTQDDPRNGLPDRNLPGEPGRPPKGINTVPFPRGGGALPPGARARRPSERGKALSIDAIMDRLSDIAAVEGKAVNLEPQGRTTIGNRLPDEQRPADGTADVRARDTDAIVGAARVQLADAATTLERALLDHSEGKAAGTLRTLVDRIRKSEAWGGFAAAVDRILEGVAFQSVSTAAVHQADAGVRPDTVLDYEEIARRVLDRDGAGSIPATLKAEIIQKVGRVLAAEEPTRADVDRVIQETIAFWQASQTETIALTEAVHAYNEGVLSVGEAAGATEAVVSDGRDDDEPCREADGQVWSIDYAREHRLEHPRCRRAFIPLVA